MKDDFQDLQLSVRELEQLCGLEVSDRWVGGMIGGVYRFSRLRRAIDWTGWAVTELMAAALLFVFSFPIGLMIARLQGSFGQTATDTTLLLGMTVSTLIGWVAWQHYRWSKGRSLQPLLHLLDEVDRYHSILDAVGVWAQLQDLRGDHRPLTETPDLRETLQLVRECLSAGLRMERIVREHLGRRSLFQDGLTQLECNLATLQTLGDRGQADEYAKLLDQALNIGLAVRHELARCSRQP